MIRVSYIKYLSNAFICLLNLNNKFYIPLFLKMTNRRTINDVVTYNQPLAPTQSNVSQNPPIPNLGAAYNNWQN